MRSWLTKLFWVLVVASFALEAWSAFALPERVPMHWSGTAGPDQWGSHTAVAIMLTGLGLIMVAVFGTLLVAIPRSRSLARVNLPNKASWQRPENLTREVHMVAADLAVIFGWLVLLTGSLLWMVAVRWRVPRDE